MCQVSDAAFEARDCFLDHPDWQATLNSVSQLGTPNFHLSKFKVSRYTFMARLGRVIKHCTNLILHPPSSAAERESSRAAALQDAAASLHLTQAWLTRWQPLLQPRTVRDYNTFLGAGDSRAARENTSLAAPVYSLAYMRCCIALGGPDAMAMEKKGCVVAMELLRRSVPQDDALAVFDLMYARLVARTMLETTEEWRAYITRTAGTGELFESEAWIRFLSKWGSSPG